MVILTQNFYDRDTAQVAYDLLGKRIIRVLDGTYLEGIIAETEAYHSEDPASHSYRGQTDRNKSMFGPVGHTYVYLSYGLHYCLNIVARDSTRYPSGAMLIRAFIPTCGQERMEKNRRKQVSFLVSGPGNVTQALAITKAHDGSDVTKSNSPLFITEGIVIDPRSIDATKRIGISVAQEVLWRFVINKPTCERIYEDFLE